MTSPIDRRYADSHEWHRIDNDVLTIGISAFAISELTDITYVEMLEVGTELAPGDNAGEVESVKATSEIYPALGGEIIEINEALEDNPGLVSEDPYNQGWLCKIRFNDKTPYESLMDAAAYDEKYPV